MPYSTIDSPNKHFDTTTYTANGGSQTITNSGSMQPDFFWGKVRSTTSNNILINSIVGVSKYLYSNTTASEVTDANYLTSFNSNGFSVGSNNYSNGTTMVAWQWKGGGTGVSNTSGTISSTVSANTTSGFSIVSYTGNGTGGATVGHGLGVKPSMMIVKRRDASESWGVWHKNLTSIDYYLRLNGTEAENSGGSTIWNSTQPTSSLTTIGTSTYTNASGGTYVLYCFADVKGFSKAFSYTGNGSSDGVFTYCGFRPAFVLIKSSSSVENWHIFDNKRNTINPSDKDLRPNTSGAETTSSVSNIDFLSNGFKLRNGDADYNGSGTTYIGFAIAEQPFVSSKGIVANAR